jgi:hypothetical protein
MVGWCILSRAFPWEGERFIFFCGYGGLMFLVDNGEMWNTK